MFAMIFVAFTSRVCVCIRVGTQPAAITNLVPRPTGIVVLRSKISRVTRRHRSVTNRSRILSHDVMIVSCILTLTIIQVGFKLQELNASATLDVDRTRTYLDNLDPPIYTIQL